MAFSLMSSHTEIILPYHAGIVPNAFKNLYTYYRVLENFDKRKV